MSIINYHYDKTINIIVDDYIENFEIYPNKNIITLLTFNENEVQCFYNKNIDQILNYLNTTPSSNYMLFLHHYYINSSTIDFFKINIDFYNKNDFIIIFFGNNFLENNIFTLNTFNIHSIKLNYNIIDKQINVYNKNIYYQLLLQIYNKLKNYKSFLTYNKSDNYLVNLIDYDFIYITLDFKNENTLYIEYKKLLTIKNIIHSNISNIKENIKNDPYYYYLFEINNDYLNIKYENTSNNLLVEKNNNMQKIKIFIENIHKLINITKNQIKIYINKINNDYSNIDLKVINNTLLYSTEIRNHLYENKLNNKILEKKQKEYITKVNKVILYYKNNKTPKKKYTLKKTYNFDLIIENHTNNLLINYNEYFKQINNTKNSIKNTHNITKNNFINGIVKLKKKNYKFSYNFEVNNNSLLIEINNYKKKKKNFINNIKKNIHIIKNEIQFIIKKIKNNYDNINLLNFTNYIHYFVDINNNLYTNKLNNDILEKKQKFIIHNIKNIILNIKKNKDIDIQKNYIQKKTYNFSLSFNNNENNLYNNYNSINNTINNIKLNIKTIYSIHKNELNVYLNINKKLSHNFSEKYSNTYTNHLFQEKYNDEIFKEYKNKIYHFSLKFIKNINELNKKFIDDINNLKKIKTHPNVINYDGLQSFQDIYDLYNKNIYNIIILKKRNIHKYITNTNLQNNLILVVHTFMDLFNNFNKNLKKNKLYIENYDKNISFLKKNMQNSLNGYTLLINNIKSNEINNFYNSKNKIVNNQLSQNYTKYYNDKLNKAMENYSNVTGKKIGVKKINTKKNKKVKKGNIGSFIF